MRNVAILGWNTVLHYGSFIGAYSLITLLPELHLGIFSSYNGAIQNDPYTVNSLLHVHLIDLFLAVLPSVDNASHWCSLPGVSQSRRSNVDETHEARGSPIYPLSAYIGIYWHVVLGEFEVLDDGTGTLMARYGSLETRLQPLQSGVEFIGVPTDPAWLMLIDNVYVKFAALNGHQQCRHVIVQLLEFTTFERRTENNAAAVSGLARTVTTMLSCRAVTALVSLMLLLHHYANH